MRADCRVIHRRPVLAFLRRGPFMDSAHQRRTEVKLKERQGALEAEAGGCPTAPARTSLPAEAEDSRRIDGVSGLALF